MPNLYVNIPICPSRCSYCSFISHQEKHIKNLIPEYHKALVSEIQGLKSRFKACYIGGGTPSIFTAEQIDELLAEIKKHSFESAELTFEAGRADTLNKAKLDVLKKHGVSRISINPQTFSNKTLEKIGRAHTAEQVIDIYNLAKSYGFIINMDLIAGLPDEGQAELENSIKTAILLEPDNITVHSLAVKRGSDIAVMAGKQIEVSQSAPQIPIKMLQNAGYLPYYLYRLKYTAGGGENIGFAKLGTYCEYNIDTMEELAPVVAVGAGGISKKFEMVDGELKIIRSHNPKDIKTYIKR